MPPRKRILREDVLDAAIRVIRRGGAPALSVRHIAGELACSTQPIYSQFGSLEGLLEALPAYAGEKYLRFCSRSYKGFALAVLRFAREEKELFKFLYLRRRKPGERLLEDVNYQTTIDLLSRNLEMPPERAREMHRQMQYHCYALGVMIATDYLDLSDGEMGRELTEFYQIMLRHYKNIQSEEELGLWLARSRNLIL